MNTTTCSKVYADLPFAHRQHMHDGHCALIHGHNWSFKFTFISRILDDCGFVVDFGKLKWLKDWLNEHFDHTLVLNEDDPWLPYLQSTLIENNGMGRPAFAKIVVVPSCSCEGLAEWLCHQVNNKLRESHGGDPDQPVWVVQVDVMEDSKNSATYRE